MLCLDGKDPNHCIINYIFIFWSLEQMEYRMPIDALPIVAPDYWVNTSNQELIAVTI